MKILVACEYSGIVRDAFLKRGHTTKGNVDPESIIAC